MITCKRRATLFQLLALSLLLVAGAWGVLAQDSFTELKKAGRANFKLNRYETALPFLLDAATLREDAEVYEMLAAIYRQKGQMATADAYAAKAARAKERPVSGPASINQVPQLSTGQGTKPMIEIISPEVAAEGNRDLLRAFVQAEQVKIKGLVTHEAGISEVLVNRRSAQLGERGLFEAVVEMQAGENMVEVSARSKNGMVSRQTFSLLYTKPSIASAPSTSITMDAPGKYYALVIGINDYRNPGVAPLKTAVKDAEVVAQVLQEGYGFEVRLLLNATRNQIIEAIIDYRKNLEEDSHLLIYYAGHGYFDKNVEKGYWLPVDATRDTPANWISASDITDQSQAIRAGHLLIISDSCYSGTLSRDPIARIDVPTERTRMINRMLESPSRTLMASGGNEPVDDGTGHSVFAVALLAGLQKIKVDVFTADELFYQHIRNQVAGSSRQIPEYSQLRGPRHKNGDFVFQRKLAAKKTEAK